MHTIAVRIPTFKKIAMKAKNTSKSAVRKVLTTRKVSAPPETVKTRSTPGRARSDASRMAILEATLKLLESTPLQQISIESIAREAGVGKATIYRWWPSKASIVIEAFIHYHGIHTPFPEGVGPSDALVRHIHLLVEEYGSWAGRIVAQLVAEGQANPAVLQEFRDRFLLVRRALVREVVDEARRTGEFRTDMDAETQEELLYAPIYMRLMFHHQPLDSQFADTHCAALMNMLRASAPKKASNRSRPTGASKPSNGSGPFS